ncbi:hypothetical protein [Paenibacillus silvae]|nr:MULTISPECIES: hypothetical protein [Paenibacillus]
MSDNLEDTFENINSYHAALEHFNGFEDFEETNEKLPTQWDK